MTDSITPIIMLAILLAGTLWLGMKYKKSGRNITEYTIGNKMFTTAALVATIVATNYGGGSLIRTVEMVYNQGLYYIILTTSMNIVYNLTCIIVASRIGLFMDDNAPSKNHISMADTLGRIYGKVPRIITAIATAGVSVAVIAIQITATSRILQTCISNVNPTYLMIKFLHPS